MLQYLARSGFYVVYPYANSQDDQDNYPTRARVALTNALATLSAQGKNVTKVAAAGHSHGGAAAVRLTATWAGPPAISALVLHDTSGHDCQGARDRPRCHAEWDYSFAALEKIPCATHLLIIQADASRFGANSMMFWKDLRHIAKFSGTSGSKFQRNYLLVPSDYSHALLLPPAILESTHLTPTVTPPAYCRALAGLMGRSDDYGCYLSSMDYYAYWEPTRAAVYEAFGGELSSDYTPYCSSETTSGRCAMTRYMGVWELDGKPATPMMNAADLRLNQTYPDYCPR
jgi:hypothetical protein